MQDSIGQPRAVSRTARFGLTVVIGYGAAFLGLAAINLLGVLFAPLVLAWIVVTVDVPAVLALRRDEHRPVSAAGGRSGRLDVPRSLGAWLVVCGLSMAVGTVGLTLYAKNDAGPDAARSVGLITLSLFHVWWALETVLPRRSILSRQLRDHRVLLAWAGLSIAGLVLAVSLPPLAGLLGTSPLGAGPWLLSLAVSLTIVVLAEVKKLLGLRLRGEADSRNGSRTAIA